MDTFWSYIYKQCGITKTVHILSCSVDCQSSSQGEEGLSVSSTTQATQTMTGEQTAISIIDDLQRMQCDLSTFQTKTGLSEDLQTIVSDKGFSICGNPGSGNCMLYALSEQLQSVKGIQISETDRTAEKVSRMPWKLPETDRWNRSVQLCPWILILG